MKDLATSQVFLILWNASERAFILKNRNLSGKNEDYPEISCFYPEKIRFIQKNTGLSRKSSNYLKINIFAEGAECCESKQ